MLCSAVSIIADADAKDHRLSNAPLLFVFYFDLVCILAFDLILINGSKTSN